MSKSNSYGTILRSSSIMAAASAVNILTGLVMLKVAAVLLGPAGVGLIGIFQNLILTASTISALGFGNIGTRQIAAANAKGEAAAIQRVRYALLWGTLVLAILGGFLFYLVSDKIAYYILDDPEAAPSVAWLAVGVVLTVAAGSQVACLTGMRRVGDVARVRVLSGLVAAPLGILAIWIWGMAGVVVFVLIVPATGFIGGHWYLAKIEKPQVPSPSLSDLASEWRVMLGLGTAFMLSALATVLAQLVARTLVQNVLGVEAQGQFQAAWSISMVYLTFVLSAMATDYYPRLVSAINDHGSMTRLVNEQTEVALLLCGPIILGMLALAPWVIRLLFSPEFAPAVTIMRWQMLGDLLKILSWPLGFVIIAVGAGRLFVATETLGAVVFVAGVFLGLSLMGIAATGASFLAMYLVYLPVVRLVAGRQIGFTWSREVKRQAVVLVGTAILICALAAFSDALSAIVGVPLALLSGLYAMVRIAYMSGAGGKLGRLHQMSNRILQYPRGRR